MIDVVVPIFNALEALKRCLRALQADPPQDARIVLINDASTEDLSGALAILPSAIVVHNECNLGFVGTVNVAFAMSRHDVVLLNSDTVPAPGWLDQMRVCAASDARIATVTPWSNNAEICSFPTWLKANPEPEDLRQWARLLLAHAPRAYPSLPTAVGFCMLIKRAALDQVGFFDAATFGRGYGEENDFCMRLSGHGWKHVLCDSTYVVHQGGASFLPLGLRPNGENYQRLLARYPGYARLIAEFIALDPMAALRAELQQRLAHLIPVSDC